MRLDERWSFVMPFLMSFQAQTGMPAKGFVFGVSLDVPGLAFLELMALAQDS